MKPAFALILALLLCSCAASRPPVQRAAGILPAVSPAVAPSGPAILALSPLPNPPATDWRAYIAGQVNWFVASNHCAAWRLSYRSNAPCWLWYNTHAADQRRLQFSSNANDSVWLPEFIRVGDALPAGENAVVIPLPKSDAGFITLRNTP